PHPSLDAGIYCRPEEPLLCGDQGRRHLRSAAVAAGNIHDQGLAREVGHINPDHHGGAEPNEGNQLRFQEFVGRPLENYSGMFPCFLGGFLSRLVSSIASAWINFLRVSRGWITASTNPRSATAYGLAKRSRNSSIF